MREIKFRAWCEKKQYYFYDVAIYPNGIIARKSNTLLDTLTEGETHWHELDNAVIEQYTGLKDKNGKEIYEGDIVRYGRHIGGIIPPESRTTVVEWWSGEEEYYPYCMTSGFALPDSEDGYEVIGNIHENPELIEKEQ